jgi:hypothetical protein
MHDIASTPQKATKDEVKVQVPGLRKVAPYWHAYATMAKQRWIGREILELVSSEFRDRSIEYYVRVYCVVCETLWKLRAQFHPTAVCHRVWRLFGQRQAS